MQIYPYQQKCLDAIESARQAGSKKALVVMATGLGKTVVSAIQLKRMLAEAPGRVLYVTNQNEILQQARRTYEKLLPVKTTYGYFHGKEKHLHKVDVLFASFQTMANSRELFARDEFRYVIVDEAHHVQAVTYRPTVEYFQPDLLIGLTATPNRTDQKDITELMGEPVFRLDLFEAITDRHLVPISYRLMTDELQNLEVLETAAGRLSIAELNRTIFVPKRDEEIVRIIEEKLSEAKNPRTILFCSSVAHAERLGKIMPYAQVLHSKVKEDQRERRIKTFRNGHSRVIITIDMFNEGIDIPEANIIVFLRSTASETVYLQQLGRGLRRTKGKDEVLVLDFVANCERIDMVRNLKEGIENATQGVDTGSGGDESEVKIRETFTLSVDGAEFDERLVDLISIVNRARQNYTKEVLAEQLLAFFHKNNRAPLGREMGRSSTLAAQITFLTVFGKRWNDILRELNIPITKTYGLDKQSMIDDLLEYSKLLGRAPTVDDMSSNSNVPDAKTYTRVFSMRWSEILTLAGLKHTKKTVVEGLNALAESLGRTPTITEAMESPLLPHPITIQRLLETNSWHDVIRKAGLEPTRKIYTKEQLTQELLDLASRLGRTPTTTDIRKEGLPNIYRFYKAFDSGWHGILRELGLSEGEEVRYTKEELLLQLFEFHKRHGRPPTRHEANSGKHQLASGNVFRRVFQKSWSDTLIEAGLKPNRVRSQSKKGG